MRPLLRMGCIPQFTQERRRIWRSLALFFKRFQIPGNQGIEACVPVVWEIRAPRFFQLLQVSASHAGGNLFRGMRRWKTECECKLDFKTCPQKSLQIRGACAGHITEAVERIHAVSEKFSVRPHQVKFVANIIRRGEVENGAQVRRQKRGMVQPEKPPLLKWYWQSRNERSFFVPDDVHFEVSRGRLQPPGVMKYRSVRRLVYKFIPFGIILPIEDLTSRPLLYLLDGRALQEWN